MLESLVYVSSAKHLFSPENLSALLLRSRVNNARRGITGLLLHVGGNFMQALEGETAHIEEVYDTISADPRHQEVKVLLRMPVPQRQFGDWAMGFMEVATLSPQIRCEISCFIQDVQREKFDDPEALDGGPAICLLKRFAETMR